MVRNFQLKSYIWISFIYSPKLHENMSTNTSNSLPRENNQSSTRTEITTISSQVNITGNIFNTNTRPSNPKALEHTYSNGIVPEIIREHTMPKCARAETLPSLPPRYQGSRTQEQRPPPLPVPLPPDYRTPYNSGVPSTPYYIDVLADPHFATYPLPSNGNADVRRVSEASSNYEHIMNCHSQQQSSASQVTHDDVYLPMSLQRKATAEIETQTTIADRLKNFRRSITRAFYNQDQNTRNTPGHSNTVPAPKRKVPPRKYKGNDAIQPKRNSAKVGTVRFKTLLSKFNAESQEDNQNQNQNGNVQENAPRSGVSRQSSCMDHVL